MLADRALDETMLGNLIYQVEMSRSDMKNLFRWLTRHASDDPEVVDTLATEHPPIAGGAPLPRLSPIPTSSTRDASRIPFRATTPTRRLAWTITSAQWEVSPSASE